MRTTLSMFVPFRARRPTAICRRTLLAVICVCWLARCHTFKPLPDGISYSGAMHPIADIRLLKDLTYVDAQGTRRVEQEIFDEAFAMIGGAERFVLLDMFLYNDFQGPTPEKTGSV